MTTAKRSTFVYVVYIRTDAQRLWQALTQPEFTKQYWFNYTPVSDWKAGSPWKIQSEDGRIADSGEILESDPPKRLVIKWRHEMHAELTAEGWSRCEMLIEPAGESVKLTIAHSIDVPHAKFIDAVSGGWPKILSNLKTLLETGKVLNF